MSATPLAETAVSRVLDLVREQFPGWEDFTDKRFHDDEIGYKQAGVKLAHELLDRPEFERLLSQNQHEKIIDKLDQIGKHNNLLYKAHPTSGDLGILYQPTLDKAVFCQQMFELLFGTDPSPDRLQRYGDWVEQNDLPNKWTFPTYFLFLMHPEAEMFVKPVTTQAFLGVVGHEISFRGRPTRDKYAELLGVSQGLLAAVKNRNPRDMVDVQSLMWVAVQALQSELPKQESSQPKPSNAEPAATYIGWFTERTFELLAELQKQPKRDFYLQHKEEFRSQVEDPFKALFGRVVELLPTDVLERMESEKNVIARILKNDYGRGGAWPFYWGALYPKDGKRIEDAQLYIWVNHEQFDFGFGLGRYSDERRERLVGGLKREGGAFLEQISGDLPPDEIRFGAQDLNPTIQRPTDWEEWANRLAETGVNAARTYSPSAIVGRDPDDLAKEIATTFTGLFPLVLVATDEDSGFHSGDVLPSDGPGESRSKPYSLEECSEETHISQTQLQQWIRAIERKRQAVFYGPPGTGKTFVAERLARHVTGGKSGFFELVQFHPSYSYEDFMQGIRPRRTPDGGLTYDLLDGRFLDFCSRAEGTEDPCVLIVDEINRANLSRVFGELMYLLEYRDKSIPLAGGRRFKIPRNVRIIGTMNTADRSIALVDHALRRRFAFLPLRPMFPVLEQFHAGSAYPIDELIAVLREVNNQIDDPHYELGISFFLKTELGRHIEDIWRMEIEPYLEEYFFDQQDKVDVFRWSNVGARLKA